MQEEHIQEVIEIEHASFSTPWSDMSFLAEMRSPESHAYVALSGSSVRGYICTKQVGKEGHILNLAVHPGSRRQGIANALVKKGLEVLRADKCLFLYLEVRYSNYIAEKLYKGFGFKAVGVKKGYYVLPAEDALIMMLEL